jgi:hypothetical protein
MIEIPIFNPSSNDHVSILLFGGYVKIKVTEPCTNMDGSFIKLKSGPNKGQLKTKRVEKLYYIKGLGLKPDKEWAREKVGFYSVDESVLKTIAAGNNDDN